MTDTLMFWLTTFTCGPMTAGGSYKISRDLYARAHRPQERPVPDPRAQQAAHHRVDRGDL